MAASNLKAPALAALPVVAALALQASTALAAHVEQQAINIEAQSSEMDFKNNNLIYRKVRISQGNSSIAADQAQGSGLNFDNSHWVFRGNVKIAMEQGQLSSDEADITFANKLLSKAVVNGKPAAFEQHIAKTGKLVQGHAESIEYDVIKGVVHFSKNAWLSNGPDEIRHDSLTYNILNQTVVADAAAQDSQRVHIIITPPANPKP
jgi:lipopolysaccharide transport protein LptA